MTRIRQSTVAPEYRDTLANRIAKLSLKRQEVIRPVLENPREFVLLSVRSMATRLGSDPATIVRIVRRMSFESYKSFQHYLHTLSMAKATPLDNMRSSTKDTSISGQIRESLDQDSRNLLSLRNSLDVDKLAALAPKIYGARRILLFGGDLAGSLIDYLHYHLLMLDLPVLAATSSGHAAYIGLSATPKDLILGISFRRGLRQTIEGMQRAKKNGAYCVGISDTYLSPIVRFSDEVFLASVEVHSFGASYAAPVALLNTVLVACASYKRPRTLTLMRQAEEEQRYGFRWFDE